MSVAYFGSSKLRWVYVQEILSQRAGSDRHMAIEVRDGSQSIMILGDCIGNHHVAFAKPEWNSGSDQDAEAAAKTRLALMDQLSHEKMRIIGFHLAGNGVGFVEKSQDGYVFTPEDT